MAKAAVSKVDTKQVSEVEEEHQVLYRKFRPRQFEDVVGQDHVIKPLQRMVAERKLGHAFLFVGPRGCGKTTTARLLAAASNCPNTADNGEPCGQCGTCAGIFSGSGAIGLHELDAASNRGIGEMKDLISSMEQGSVARKKVYVIDEAHMLTREASNALLKTLEEPPADTLIILATTEPNKILDTIQSRAVRYNFKTIDPKIMTGLVQDIVKATKMDIDEQGIAEVIRRGHGSPRDTLTALEGYGGADANDDVAPFIKNITEALADRDSSALIISIAEAVDFGVDVPDLTRSLLEHWRNCLLALKAPSSLVFTGKELKELTRQAKGLQTNRVVRLLNVTSEALGKMSSSGDARLLLETSLLQVALPSVSDSVDGLYECMEEIVDKLNKLIKSGVSQSAAPSASNSWPQIDSDKGEREAVKPESEPETDTEDSEPRELNDEPVDDADDVTEEYQDEENDEPDSDEDDTDSDSSDDYDQWEDEMEAESQEDDADDEDYSDSKSDTDDEDDEPEVLSIDELYDDADDEPEESADDADDAAEEKVAPEHNHDKDDKSGFLDCDHPDCIQKHDEMEASEKELSKEEDSSKKKSNTKEAKSSKPRKVTKEEAPTIRDLIEVIQHELIAPKYARYLQDTVMDAEMEDGYLVFFLRDDSPRVPTAAAIDAIMNTADYLWVKGVEYDGEER